MRISTSKSKNNESFYIVQSFINAQGKNTTKTFKSLGNLDYLSDLLGTDRDGVMKWAKEQARIATEQFEKDNERVHISLSPVVKLKKDEEQSFNCGYLFLQSICSKLRFENISRNIKTRHNFQFNLESILSDLVYSRILSPSSKRSSYSFSKTLLEKPKYELHDVYRALSVLAEESDYIQSELYKNSQFLHNRNTDILYYDCTNYFFEIEEADGIKAYGKSKENRPNPIVGMGLFMDGDGIPLAFDIFPGNQNEQLSLRPIEEKVINDFDCSNFIFCSDSGLASRKNKLFNTHGGRSYVITQSLKKLKKEDKEIALATTQYKLVGSNTFIDLKDLDESDPSVYNAIYYKEIPVYNKDLSETIIVTYSPKYKAYQEGIRQGQIDRAVKMIGDGKKLSRGTTNPNDPKRFISRCALTEQGEVAESEEYSINQDAILKEAQYDGFYAVATDLDEDVSDIIKISQRRWQIEECFRIMKTDFEARPVYLSREDRIKAHFLTCFISLLVYRLLDQKLEEKYTVTELLKTLRGMNVKLIDSAGYIPTYMRTDITDDLHHAFGFETDTEIIKKSKMKNIIKETKKK